MQGGYSSSPNCESTAESRSSNFIESRRAIRCTLMGLHDAQEAVYGTRTKAAGFQ